MNKELDDLRSKLTGVRVRNNATVADNSVHSVAHELHARFVFNDNIMYTLHTAPHRG